MCASVFDLVIQLSTENCCWLSPWIFSSGWLKEHLKRALQHLFIKNIGYRVDRNPSVEEEDWLRYLSNLQPGQNRFENVLSVPAEASILLKNFERETEWREKQVRERIFS